MIAIENREYNAGNTSEQEIDAIKKRIKYYDEELILWKEVPIPTGFVQKLFFDRFIEIVKQGQNFYLIIDLREVLVKKVDAEHREVLKNTFEYYKSQIIHCCVVVGPNIFMRLAAKIALRNRIRSSSVHSRMEDALDKISEIRK